MDDPVADLTTPDGVADLMRTSRSQAEWDANSSKVKAANGGNYPPFCCVRSVDADSVGTRLGGRMMETAEAIIKGILQPTSGRGALRPDEVEKMVQAAFQAGQRFTLLRVQRLHEEEAKNLPPV